MQQQELIPHLFRNEYGKITAVLCKFFGIENMEVAGDIASETFLTALETWPYNGIPANPTGWLYAVAKNKAINYANRDRLFADKIAAQLKKIADRPEQTGIDLSDKNISDSQLQMLFAICHPSISEESQIVMALRCLCGFGIAEIADALLTSKETINKRLFRARERLRSEKVRIEFPGEKEIDKRLNTVLICLYLMFNEGYYSESNNSVLREDLCLEAMHLTYLLIENEHTNTPDVNALFSLMCFHSSRFEARKNKNGEIILYDDQDDALWNHELISKGAYYLSQASRQKNQLSRYHLEAAIAYWNTRKADTAEKWENILQLYNLLLQFEYSPVAALNRTYALSKVKGKQHAIVEAGKLDLTNNQYYFALLGELYTGGDNAKAIENFTRAFALAKTTFDKQALQKRIDSLHCDKQACS